MTAQSETRDTSVRMVLLVLSGCNFIIGLGAMMIVGLLEPVSQDLGVSITAAGSMMTVYSIAFACLAPVLVAVTGQSGRRRIISFGFALFITATGLGALVPDLISLYATRVFAAAGAGLVTPVSLAVAAAISPPEQRGKAMASVFLGLTLAQVFGVPAGSWIAYTYGWRAAMVLVFVLGLPCLWLLWTHIPAGLRFDPVTLRDLGGVLRDPVALVMVGFTAVFLGAIYVLYTYLPTLLSQAMQFGRDGISLALLIFGAAAPLGNQLGGWMTDRLGPVRTLIWVSVAQILIMPAFSVLPMPAVLLMAAIFFWSLSGWVFSAPQQVRLVTHDAKLAPVLMSLNAAAIYVGIAIGSAAGGAVLQHMGIDALGVTAAVVSLASLGVLLLAGVIARR
jgi:DHA1 family inner membrane transport protein